jgi:hypothetical protein
VLAGDGRWVGEARGTHAKPVGVPAGPDGGQRRRAMTRCSDAPDSGMVRLEEDSLGRRLSSSKTAPSQ